LRESDAFLCGRVTYEVFKEFCPQVKAGEYRQMLNRMRKFVASRTLSEPLEWNATPLEGEVADAVSDLKQEEGRDIATHGSARRMRLDGSRSDRRVPDLDPSTGHRDGYAPL
jgi:dihydrofolate reductase